MFTKRFTSLFLCLMLLLTMTVVPATVNAATVDTAESGNNVVGFNLPDDIHDGNILHAFSWKLKEVTQYAADIAAAGYTAVQVSPIQTTKDTTNDGAFANDWWCFYQPLDMKIGNELGDADDLREMCDTLHSYGIKVICDVVANHVQNSTDKTEAAKVNATLKSYLRNTSGTRLTPYDDSSRKGQTSTDLNSQLPDIDTSNKDYQNYLINYLNSLADCGVDGFRFDAAKHIETPDDTNCASDFWPTITSAILKKNPDAYIYGEVLGINKNLLSITAYTKYIDVTDYAYGDTVRAALSSKKASALSDYGYVGSADEDNVLWLESHDTFTTNPATSGSSNNLTIAQQIVGWAVVGARKDAPALYLIRTNCSELDVTPKLTSIKYDELIGAPGAADTWQNKAVVAVNQFKNEFVGQSESTYDNGSLFFVQRGTTGMVIANLATGSANVSQACTMADGTYVDQVTGNTFTVSNGTITGRIGDSGVAVVYNPKKIPPTADVYLNSLKLTSDTLNGYTGATATVNIELKNATSGIVKVSNLPAQDVPADGMTITLNDSIDYGDGVNITVTATNGTQTTTVTHKVYKKNANETKRVYFDNTVTQWPAVYVYCKTGLSRTTEISDFPGYEMEKVAGNDNLYYYDVPAQTNYVKFSEGPVSAHIGHNVTACGGYCGRTMPPTVIYYGTANSAANRESGGYQLTGSMIFNKLEFKDYGEYPIANLSSSDVTFKDFEVIPTESRPIEIPDTLMLGDVDLSLSISILDATAIQRHLAKLITLTSEQQICANVDANDSVTILDATNIQRHLAKLPAPAGIGKFIDEPVEPTIPVETRTITLNDTTAFEGGEIYVYAYGEDGNSNGEWPGQKMTQGSGVYTLDVDKTLTHLKFVGVYGEITSEASPATIETNVFEITDSPYTLETLTLTSKQKWTDAHIHLWNEDPVNPVTTTWPGIKMNGKAGSWTFNIPKDSAYEKYIINNGGSQQDGTQYIVEPDNMVDIYFTDTLGWSNVYAYTWHGSTGSQNASWPGKAMEFVETNDQNQNVYKITVEPGAFTNIIFNKGNGGVQTVNLDLQGIPNEGFYPTTISGDKYECGTYIYGEPA